MTPSAELDKLKDQRSAYQSAYDDANRQYKIGMWAVLIGVFLVPAYGLGLLLILAGGLAAANNNGKRKSAQASMMSIEKKIEDLRAKL